MADIVFIEEDFVRVKTGNKSQVVLAWGDQVEVLGKSGGRTKVRVHGRGATPFTGTVKGNLPTRKEGVLHFSMIDVQQGDGMIMQTPQGKKIFIDGGDNKLFARFAAARYPNTTKDNPLVVDAMIVTHGDADHFDGLNKIKDSETHKTPRKRLFIYPKRIFHNGLVKGPGKLKPDKIFGRTVPTRDGRAIVDLVDDVREVNSSKLNVPFRRWVKSIRHWAKHGPIDIRRLAFGDKREFQFLKDERIRVDVYGPTPMRVKVGNSRKPALPLLHQPPKSVNLPVEGFEESNKPFSASHTVNGHSVSLKITYGNVRFMLTGDLNQESMEIVRKKVSTRDLQSEIIKAPHHGSADFDLKALKAMAPVVSLISSGDESSRKEHIHPRATLMGALGHIGRGDTSLVFCTELAAFFELRGLSKALEGKKKGKTYFGFERTNFGIIQIRTDGRRVLVFTHSGKADMKEAYRFTVDDKHHVKFAKDVKKR